MTSKRNKAVSAIDIETGTETLYPSLSAFCKKIGCSYSFAIAVISSRESTKYYTTCKGYSLRYLDEDERNDRKDEIIGF